MRRIWYGKGTGWLYGWAIGYFGGVWGGFVVAAPEDFQEFQQLVGGLWVGYLVDGFVEKNPCG